MRFNYSSLLSISFALPTMALAWSVTPYTSTPTIQQRITAGQTPIEPGNDRGKDGTVTLHRRSFLQNMVKTVTVATVATTTLSATPRVAQADVYSGTELPKGVAQFNRCIRLKRDLKKVTQRVQNNSNEMDAAEWDNVGKFLRQVYAVAGDDMKLVAGGIVNAEMKQRALQDADKLRQYAQAADVPVSAKDATGFVVVAQKMNDLVQDYFDALVDVPDL